MIQISAKMEWFVAGETTRMSKNFIRICQQLIVLSAKFAGFLLSNNGKNFFKKYIDPEYFRN